MEESLDIEDFKVHSYEIDTSKSVPKLKGQSNFRDWETALYLALGANNRYYTHMISNGIIPLPTPPYYADTTPEAVRDMLVKEGLPVSSGNDCVPTISSTQIRTRIQVNVEANELLRKEYITKCINWQSCNSRACVQLRNTLGVEAKSLVSQKTDVREAFKKLKKTYASSSHQQAFVRYTKWVDLLFKNGTASNFVRKFQEALCDLTATAGALPPVVELCQFKMAIAENSRCHAFLQNLKVIEKDANLMDKVYVEFVDAETNNRSLSQLNNRHD
ncbi:hypothetical protein PITC_032770 [Penicillium italicum]|uniref:Uncharacterized protein n=1 Tax=Penicillium italicum TaxID=40296 RepID=A0A0A2L9H3_PENIT|nr:hypothetical protein PITC_032770 [Penicillium italicum]